MLKKFLCFDVGTKYIGCAFGHNSEGHKYTKTLHYVSIKKNKVNFNLLNNMIINLKPDALIIGMPTKNDANNQFIIDYIKKIRVLLAIKYDICAFEFCEHLTSWHAKNIFIKKVRHKVKNRIINSYSAKIILDNFLLKHF